MTEINFEQRTHEAMPIVASALISLSRLADELLNQPDEVLSTSSSTAIGAPRHHLAFDDKRGSVHIVSPGEHPPEEFLYFFLPNLTHTHPLAETLMGPKGVAFVLYYMMTLAPYGYKFEEEDYAPAQSFYSDLSYRHRMFGLEEPQF